MAKTLDFQAKIALQQALIEPLLYIIPLIPLQQIANFTPPQTNASLVQAFNNEFLGKEWNKFKTSMDAFSTQYLQALKHPAELAACLPVLDLYEDQISKLKTYLLTAPKKDNFPILHRLMISYKELVQAIKAAQPKIAKTEAITQKTDQDRLQADITPLPQPAAIAVEFPRIKTNFIVMADLEKLIKDKRQDQTTEQFLENYLSINLKRSLTNFSNILKMRRAEVIGQTLSLFDRELLDVIRIFAVIKTKIYDLVPTQRAFLDELWDLSSNLIPTLQQIGGHTSYATVIHSQNLLSIVAHVQNISSKINDKSSDLKTYLNNAMKFIGLGLKTLQNCSQTVDGVSFFDPEVTFVINSCLTEINLMNLGEIKDQEIKNIIFNITTLFVNFDPLRQLGDKFSRINTPVAAKVQEYQTLVGNPDNIQALQDILTSPLFGVASNAQDKSNPAMDEVSQAVFKLATMDLAQTVANNHNKVLSLMEIVRTALTIVANMDYQRDFMGLTSTIKQILDKETGTGEVIDEENQVVKLGGREVSFAQCQASFAQAQHLARTITYWNQDLADALLGFKGAVRLLPQEITGMQESPNLAAAKAASKITVERVQFVILDTLRAMRNLHYLQLEQAKAPDAPQRNSNIQDKINFVTDNIDFCLKNQRICFTEESLPKLTKLLTVLHDYDDVCYNFTSQNVSLGRDVKLFKEFLENLAMNLIRRSPRTQVQAAGAKEAAPPIQLNLLLVSQNLTMVTDLLHREIDSISPHYSHLKDSFRLLHEMLLMRDSKQGQILEVFDTQFLQAMNELFTLYPILASDPADQVKMFEVMELAKRLYPKCAASLAHYEAGSYAIAGLCTMILKAQDELITHLKKFSNISATTTLLSPIYLVQPALQTLFDLIKAHRSGLYLADFQVIFLGIFKGLQTNLPPSDSNQLLSPQQLQLLGFVESAQLAILPFATDLDTALGLGEQGVQDDIKLLRSAIKVLGVKQSDKTTTLPRRLSPEDFSKYKLAALKLLHFPSRTPLSDPDPKLLEEVLEQISDYYRRSHLTYLLEKAVAIKKEYQGKTRDDQDLSAKLKKFSDQSNCLKTIGILLGEVTFTDAQFQKDCEKVKSIRSSSTLDKIATAMQKAIAASNMGRAMAPEGPVMIKVVDRTMPTNLKAAHAQMRLREQFEESQKKVKQQQLTEEAVAVKGQLEDIDAIMAQIDAAGVQKKKDKPPKKKKPPKSRPTQAAPVDEKVVKKEGAEVPAVLPPKAGKVSDTLTSGHRVIPSGNIGDHLVRVVVADGKRHKLPKQEPEPDPTPTNGTNGHYQLQQDSSRWVDRVKKGKQKGQTNRVHDQRDKGVSSHQGQLPRENGSNAAVPKAVVARTLLATGSIWGNRAKPTPAVPTSAVAVVSEKPTEQQKPPAIAPMEQQVPSSAPAPVVAVISKKPLEPQRTPPPTPTPVAAEGTEVTNTIPVKPILVGYRPNGSFGPMDPNFIPAPPRQKAEDLAAQKQIEELKRMVAEQAEQVQLLLDANRMSYGYPNLPPPGVPYYPVPYYPPAVPYGWSPDQYQPAAAGGAFYHPNAFYYPNLVVGPQYQEGGNKFKGEPPLGQFTADEQDRRTNGRDDESKKQY